MQHSKHTLKTVGYNTCTSTGTRTCNIAHVKTIRYNTCTSTGTRIHAT